MPNILVTGANGQLGSEIRALASAYGYRFFFMASSDLNICDENAIQEKLTEHQIDIIINCAAYTAVDKAEEDITTANKINNLATASLSKIAKDNAISFIHISTDYVFDGTHFKPYTEEIEVNPKGVYGQTKLDGEKAMQAINPKNSIIIRTSWVYSTFGTNFVKTMLRLGKEKESLGVIFDQVGTPTYAKDLARAILDIAPQIQNNSVEIYHYSNEGVCSWYDFATEIMEIANLSCHINPIKTVDYPTPATRPHYSLLNKNKIKNTYQLTIPNWKESLKECIQTIGVKKHV